jgi:hypothetical protein
MCETRSPQLKPFPADMKPLDGLAAAVSIPALSAILAQIPLKAVAMDLLKPYADLWPLRHVLRDHKSLAFHPLSSRRTSTTGGKVQLQEPSSTNWPLAAIAPSERPQATKLWFRLSFWSASGEM